MARDIALVIEDNPDLLGDIVKVYPQRFADLITKAIAQSARKPDREIAVAQPQTLISISIGLKHQVSDIRPIGSASHLLSTLCSAEDRQPTAPSA